MEFAKKIEIQVSYEKQTTTWAKHYKVGTAIYDIYGKFWEVGEDVNYDKFFFREVKK